MFDNFSDAPGKPRPSMIFDVDTGIENDVRAEVRSDVTAMNIG